MMQDARPMANPTVVLREEFDDWALLFDPDTNAIFTVDPVGVYIWKRLDGRRAPGDIVEALRRDCEVVPEDALTYVNTFIEDLLRRGLAGYEFKTKA